jgi:hypothetical protein
MKGEDKPQSSAKLSASPILRGKKNAAPQQDFAQKLS